MGRNIQRSGQSSDRFLSDTFICLAQNSVDGTSGESRSARKF